MRNLILALVIGSLPAAAGTLSAQTGDADRALASAILAELISYRTTAGSGETVAAARAMARRLIAAGFTEEDVQIVGPTPDLGNLVARLRGRNASRNPILLLAHMDVVPALAGAWTTAPYELVEEGGYYYGRGTSDNKAGVATLIANLIRWKREGWVPDRDVIAVMTADEETTQASIAWLMRERSDLANAEFALNTDAGFGELRDGRPAIFAVQASEKVYVSFRLTASNAGGHSSLPRPDNAINDLVRALARIADHAFPVRTDEITRAFFARTADAHPKAVADDMRSVADDPEDLTAAARLADQSPHFNATLRTTCIATMLDAGHAENALPREASAVVNCRIFPGQDPGEIETVLREVIGNPSITMTRMQEPVASPPSPLAPEVMSTLEQVAAEIFPGATLVPVMSTGATDGLYVRNAGVPTYGVSAIFDEPDDVRAHGKDERVGVRAFHDAVEFWYRMVKRLASEGAIP